jgi:predicted dehydrogenase
MSGPLNIGLIGLGVMGQRMLARLQGHPRLRAVVAWDADPAAIARALQAQPGLKAAASAADVIGHPGLHNLYIATPPQAHLALSEAAFDAGLAVLCEKPLTVDFDAARRSIARIAREQQRAAVNFVLASSPGLAALQRAFGQQMADRPLGALQSVDIDVAFAAWPRPWQAAAGPWLSERTEGGFTREVLSHFVFALQRVLGPTRVLRAQASWPGDGLGAETTLQATLEVTGQAGGVPVTVTGRVAADVPVADHNRMRWQAEGGAIELRQWFSDVQVQQGGPWSPLAEVPALRPADAPSQLDRWAAMIDGQPAAQHGLADFAEALAVQETIEALLRA